MIFTVKFYANRAYIRRKYGDSQISEKEITKAIDYSANNMC